MVEEKDMHEMVDFVGAGLVTLAPVYPSGSGYFLDELHTGLLDAGISEQRIMFSYSIMAASDGYCGPLEPTMYKGGKLLIIDRDLSTNIPLLAAKRLAKLKAPVDRIRYVTEKPFKMLTIEDLFLDAYVQGKEMSYRFLGKDVEKFIERNKPPKTSGLPVFSSRSARRFGIGVALAMDNKNRKLYSETESDLPLQNDCLLVFIDESGAPRVKEIKGSKPARKILVVDDSIDGRGLIEYLLKDSYGLDCSSSIDEAIAKMGEHYDLLISDIRFPENINGGFLIAEEAKKNFGDRVILTTAIDINASENSGVAQRAEELGLFLIPKPYKPQRFKELVDLMMEKNLDRRKIDEVIGDIKK